MPTLARRCIGKYVAGKSRCPEHIEIVDFSERTLNFFQIFAPRFVLGWEKVFDNVTKAFDGDPQRVQGDLRAVAQRASVQCTSFGPAFEGQMFEQAVSRPDVSGPRRKKFRPLLPLLLIEFFKSGAGFALLPLFTL